MTLRALVCLSTAYALQIPSSLSRSPLRALRMSQEFTVGVLGDLHLDPRYMDDHVAGREHFKKVFENGKRPNSFVVSLGGND